MIYAVAVLALVSLIEAFALVRYRRARVVDRSVDRLAHFAEALALLTDTTEAGFANLATELQTKRPAVRGSSRTATSRRIATAVRRGQSLEEIVSRESLSESEIRLHLGLSAADLQSQGDRRDAVALR